MKYFSDKLNKLFETPEECQKAELDASKKEAEEKALAEKRAAELKEKKEKEALERKAMATEVEEARKNMVAAQKAYQEKIKAFVDKYHTYHFSTTKVEDIPSLFDIFDKFWF